MTDKPKRAPLGQSNMRSIDRAILEAKAEGVREEQEKMEIRLASACLVIEEKYGGDSQVWKDVHEAFCKPSPLPPRKKKKKG